MTNKIESGKNLSEILKNAFTILAIVIGASWTYVKFVRVESPSLEPRGTASSSLYWNDLDSSKCEGVFDVNFTNSGNTSFDITKVQVQAWKFRRPWIAAQFATYLDTDEVKRTGERIFEKPYSETLPGGGIHMFIGHYPPGSSFRHSFVLSMSKAPDQSVYWEADFYMNNSKDPHTYTGSWSSVCNFPRPSPSPFPSPSPTPR